MAVSVQTHRMVFNKFKVNTLSKKGHQLSRNMSCSSLHHSSSTHAPETPKFRAAKEFTITIRPGCGGHFGIQAGASHLVKDSHLLPGVLKECCRIMFNMSMSLLHNTTPYSPRKHQIRPPFQQYQYTYSGCTKKALSLSLFREIALIIFSNQ
jgi:hypothetical protein